MAVGDLNKFTGLWEVRIVYANAGEGNKRAMKTVSGAVAKGDASVAGAVLTQSDPRKLPIVQKTKKALGEDSKILIEVKNSVADVFDNGDNDAEEALRIPITILDTETGDIEETFLRSKDCTGGDTTCIVDEWTKLLTYTVKAQNRVKIGHGIAEDSKLFFYPLIADTAA